MQRLRVSQYTSSIYSNHVYECRLPYRNASCLNNSWASCLLAHWQIMEYTGRCVAVSEPNSPTIVAMKYRKFGDSPELRQMARDVIRLECRPYATMQPPPLGYFLKFKAPDAAALPLFRQRLTFYRLSFQLVCRIMACTTVQAVVYRVTTCLENLEMSENLTAVREMSGILLKVS